MGETEFCRARPCKRTPAAGVDDCRLSEESVEPDHCTLGVGWAAALSSECSLSQSAAFSASTEPISAFRRSFSASMARTRRRASSTRTAMSSTMAVMPAAIAQPPSPGTVASCANPLGILAPKPLGILAQGWARRDDDLRQSATTSTLEDYELSVDIT